MERGSLSGMLATFVKISSFYNLQHIYL